MKAPRIRLGVLLAVVLAGGAAAALIGVAPAFSARPTQPTEIREKLQLGRPWTGELRGEMAWQSEHLSPSALYTVSAWLETVPLFADQDFQFSLAAPGGVRIEKTLHAGDPDIFVTFRPREGGIADLRLLRRGGPHTRAVQAGMVLNRMEVASHQQLAFEAEPNDSWQEANPMLLGRAVYGSCDDIEYLDNRLEYQVGWDWFRIDFEESEPKLVYFDLDITDRDIPVQLLFYRYDPASASIQPYVRGKDPMEVLHDGQKVRYSKFISRVLSAGRYYVAVLGNHPSYILRTTLYPVPPYEEPGQAVETAMHYLLSIGDAWFAQVPRLGSRHRRSVMLHDEAVRCTACHPTVFPLESNLTAFGQGYPIRAKSQFYHLMRRVYNAPTPLYGNPGVNWVRFVAIQLQFFGKQGGLVMDYENSVTGKPTPFLGRFTGFLQAAWDHRDALPEDENNGVSPLDSKFGFAWRDWRVLDQMARRTGDGGLRNSADHIEKIVSSPQALKRLEGTQDRLHRLHGLALMDAKRYKEEIAQAIRYFLDGQNGDGGWPGNQEKPSSGDAGMESTESVEYLTAQTIHTLLTVGAGERERPRLHKAAAWLLSRQQEFGGWFQTETIENFVTPMRETRYAVMALSTLYPAGRPSPGLGNRDEKPARVPATAPLLAVLDDLDNLWDVPDRARFAAALVPLLRHENPWVRSLAAECLGRTGDESAVDPLVELLGDPVKMAWRSAAWALRELGNQGVGLAGIGAALGSSDPGIRRGAARIFAYQFYGMDGRGELRERFFPLLQDPDLLTRHQAVQTLSQWWYRTVDRGVRKRIFQTFIDRLADAEEHPLQRFNLSQGLYNLLDENLGSPGTGYGRWIEYLRPARQEALRAERRWQEQEILLQPIFAALRDGPAQQRLGVLLAFDGTPFWRGYTSAAFGPGNDRAFDFERKNDFAGLVETFAAVLSRIDQPRELFYGLQLGAFFDVFRGPQAGQLLAFYLDSLLHRDRAVRQAAAEIAGRVSLPHWEEAQAEKLLRLADPPGAAGQSLSADEMQERSMVVLEMLRANPLLLRAKGLADVVRRSVSDPNLSSIALPLMAAAEFTEEEALAALLRAWPRSLPQDTDAPESYRRLLERNSLLNERVLERTRRSQAPAPPQPLVDCLALLEKRAALLEKPAVILRLAGAARVDNGRVRQLVFELLARHPRLSAHRLLLPLAQGALMDVRAEVRRAALQITAAEGALLDFPEVYDYLVRLLVDSDARVRRTALDVVGRHQLIGRERAAFSTSRLAGGVKALEVGEKDEAVRNRAAAILREAGLEPADVRPAANLLQAALPDFEEFRRRVNPYFYREAAHDGRACANCHATHRILRLAEPPPAGHSLSEQTMRDNYRSLLKVIDLNEPERSLVLRKPLSPSGQGEQDVTSPTGLTHVGGRRWSGPEDPAFQAILSWIRTAPR